MTTFLVTPTMTEVLTDHVQDVIAEAYPNELEALRSELAKAKAENAKLTAGKSDGLSIRVSEKGAVSIYGLGRFPVTLYMSQWVALIKAVPTIEAFIQANVAKLAAKPTVTVKK